MTLIITLSSSTLRYWNMSLFERISNIFHRKHGIESQPQPPLHPQLDEDIRRMAYSFHFPLKYMMTPAFRMKDNYISPHEKHSVILSSCYIIFLAILCLYLTSTETEPADDMNEIEVAFLNLSLKCYFVTYLTSVLMIFLTSIVHSNNTVSLILKIQAIHRTIYTSNCIKSYITWNWILIGSLFVLNTIVNVLFYASDYEDKINDVCEMIFDFLIIVPDVNSLIAVRIMVLLKRYIDRWIEDVLELNNNEQEDESECRKLLEVYRNILASYDLYKRVFQVLVRILIILGNF